MKTDALFIVFMISITLVTNMRKFSDDNMTPSSNIDDQLFQMKMKILAAEDPMTIKVFIVKIQEMLKDIEDNQAKHELINKNMTQQCTEEEKFRKMEIQDSQDSFKSSSDAQNKCQMSFAEGTKFLPQLESSVSDFKNQIKTKTDERTIQHQQYLDLQKQWENAITFLKGFSKKIEQTVKNKTSFIQLGEDLIRHVAKLGRLQKLVPIFIELSSNQTPVKRDAAAVAGSTVSNKTIIVNQSNIIEPPKNDSKPVEPLSNSKLDYLKKIVEELTSQLVKDSYQSDIDEANMQKSFERFVSDLNKIIKNLEDSIARIKAQITAMDLCIKKETVIMNEASAKKVRNEKLLSMADRTCKDFLNSFVESTKNRLRQIESMRGIIDIVKKRFGEIPKELSKMLTDMDTQFKTYINATEFKKYEEITKTRIEDNLNGKKLSSNQL